MKIVNITGKFQSPNIFGKGQPKDEYTMKITELCDKFKQQDNLIDIVKIFNNDSKLKIQDPSTYDMDIYRFLIGTKDHLLDYKKTLSMLNKHKISCCPQLKQSAQNKNKHYTLLVLKTPEQEELMKNFTQDSKYVDTLSKCEFVQELENLAKKENVYNPSILEDTNNIKITSARKLFVPDWSNTDKFNSIQEKAEYFNELRKVFNLTY